MIFFFFTNNLRNRKIYTCHSIHTKINAHQPLDYKRKYHNFKAKVSRVIVEDIVSIAKAISMNFSRNEKEEKIPPFRTTMVHFDGGRRRKIFTARNQNGYRHL